VYAAVRRNSPLDYAARTFAALARRAPFWLGLLLVLVFGVLLRRCPVGAGTPLHVVPRITLGWFAVAGLMRLHARRCSTSSAADT